MLFHYRALLSGGKKRKGVIDADSYALAKERLIAEGVIVIELIPYEERSMAKVKLSLRERLHFTQDLCHLLSAGLPLLESLLSLEEKHRGSGRHPLFLHLMDQVRQGNSLSSALEKYPLAFDTIYVSMVRAGEKTGNLQEVFKGLAKGLKKEQKLRQELQSALFYPSFLGGFCFLILIALFFILIPSMKELYEGRVLHPFTQSILALSTFLCDHVMAVVVVGIALILSPLCFFRSQKGVVFWQRFSLRAPLLKAVMLPAILVRFCRSLSALLQSGVPIIEGLVLAKGAVKNMDFEKGIERAAKSLSEGKPLSEALLSTPHLPFLVLRMIAVGEEGGDIATMLTHIAQVYEEDLEKSLHQFLHLLQPLLLLSIGIVLGVILVAILIPLTDVGGLINT